MKDDTPDVYSFLTPYKYTLYILYKYNNDDFLNEFQYISYQNKVSILENKIWVNLSYFVIVTEEYWEKYVCVCVLKQKRVSYDIWKAAEKHVITHS